MKSSVIIILAGFLLLPFVSNFQIQAQGGDYYRQGKLAFSSRNYEQAYDLFQKALQSNPSDGNPLFYMGYILEQQNRRGDAVAAYQRAVNLRMDADLREKAFWKIVLHYKFTRDWDNLYVYSEKFLKVNDSSGVRQLYELAEQNRDPRVTQVNRLMREGEKLEKDGKTSEAAGVYRRALGIKSDHHPARWQLALAQIQLKEYRDAESQLRMLIKADAGRWEYHYKAGICNLQMNRYDDALRDMDRARELNEKPGKSFVYYVNLAEGIAYLEREEYERAKNHFDAALKARSTARVEGALARAQWELGDYAAAETNANHALKKESDQADALLVYTLVAINKGKSDAYAKSQAVLGVVDAEQAQSQSTVVPERFTPVMLYLGREATRAKNWDLALRAFEKVNMKRLQAMYETERRQNPGNHSDALRDYNYHYGQALFHAGRDSQAIITLKRVENSHEADYMIARAYAREGQTEGARTYLKKAATTQANYWQSALQETAFTNLMRRSPEFDFFVRNRGRDPEPVPVPESSTETNGAPRSETKTETPTRTPQ